MKKETTKYAFPLRERPRRSVSRSFTFLSLLLTLLLLTGCTSSQERSYGAGQKALASENFAEASAAFEKAGSFDDSARLLQYANAWQLLESGDFPAATSAFRALSDFKDCILMTSYCLAREQEALAQSAFSSESLDTAVSACGEAIRGYTSLSLFRDSDERASACRSLLYEKATEWLKLSRFGDAASAFDALDGYLDSAGLGTYCRASLLLQQGLGLEAAEIFSQIPDVLDAGERAEASRSQAYETAVGMRDRGEYEAAAEVFASLGGYRDANAQRDSSLQLLIRTLLATGSYHEALQKLSLLSDASLFPPPDSTEAESVDIYLKTFIGTWLNAHAEVMGGFFARGLLQSYIEPGGELEGLLAAELPDDMPHENYGFVFNQDGEVQQLLKLDDNFLAARVHGTASSYGTNASGNTMSETLLVLVNTAGYFPVVYAVLPIS